MTSAARDIKALLASVRSLRGQSETRSSPAQRLASFFGKLNRTDLGSSPETLPETRCSVPKIEAEALASFFVALRPFHDAHRRDSAAIDLWGLTGVGRDELLNARILSWLLDAEGSHLAGGALREAWLAQINARTPRAWLTPAQTSPVDVLVEYYPMGDAESRVDLALVSADSVVFVEVKVDAGEGHEQLARYRRLARLQANSRGHSASGVIYLTPWAESGADDPPDLVHTSWRELARVLEREAAGAENLFAQQLIRSFSRHIRSF